jgi:hypothetical protein
MELIVAGAILLFTIIPNSENIKVQNPFSPSPSPSSVNAIAIAPIPTDKPKEPSIHKVGAGETLDSIAKDEYGASKYWTSLWNDNDFIEDPRIIHAGLELKIRSVKPDQAEELNERLAKIYEEIISPSPTPSPTTSPQQQPTNVNPVTSGSFDEAYKQAGARFGVPWEILYGIHHMETGGRDGAISSGYGTGAQGPLQFMPGTWAAYGIDGNGDGNIDINNAIDAIFGAANFISRHGGVEQGLKSYGGNIELVLNYARSRGYNP